MNAVFRSLSLFLVLVLLTFASQTRLASANGQEGHGGDPDVAEFLDLGRWIVRALSTWAGNEMPEVDRRRLSELVNRVEVRAVEALLYLRAGDSIPIPIRNSFPTPLIQFNRSNWRDLRNAYAKMRMVFHEYCYFLQLSDEGYVESERFLQLVRVHDEQEQTRLAQARASTPYRSPAVLQSRRLSLDWVDQGCESSGESRSWEAADRAFVAFQVSGRSFSRTSIYEVRGRIALSQESGSDGIPIASLEVRPYTRYVNVTPNAPQLRLITGALPVQINRVTSTGNNLSINVYAITLGVGGTEEPGMFHSPHELRTERERFRIFAQVAVDLLGYMYLNLRDHSNYDGLGIAGVSATIGFGLDMPFHTRIRTTLIGARSDFGILPIPGVVPDPTGATPSGVTPLVGVYFHDIYSRLDYFILDRLGLFVQGGFRQLHLTIDETRVTRTEADGSTTRGGCFQCIRETNYYLNGGIRLEFEGP